MSLTQINKAGLDEIALDHVFTIGAYGSSAYTFQGEGLNGTVNNPTLYLTRGKTYRFENGSGGHPIRIQSTSGASGTAYNTGVTNNAGSGTVIVEVQHDAPDVLYYQCTSHAAMNGILYITGALADGGVTTAKIADDAVTAAKINTNAVFTGSIQDGAVTTAKLSNDAVTTVKITDSNITNAKLANSSVSTAKLQDGSVTTAKISDEAVTLAKLEHGTSSNNGKFLRANNGADPTFETVNTDLVSDTSPQLGGNLASNGNNIIFADTTGASNNRLVFGANTDMSIYHEPNNNYIDADTGTLHIRHSGEIGAKFIKNGGVELYHDNDKKLETQSYGINVQGVNSVNTQIKIHGQNVIGRSYWGYSTGYSGTTVGRTDNSVASTIFMGVDVTGNSSGSFGGQGNEIVFRNDHIFKTPNAANNNYVTPLRFGRATSTEGAVNFPQGLMFGADQADANILHDYEEGTWTPFVRYYSNGAWYATTMTSDGSKSAKYTKIGDIVYFDLGWHSWEVQNANYALISGLPFTCSHRGAFTVTYTNAFHNNQNLGGMVSTNSTFIEFYRDNNNWNAIKNNQSGMYIYGSGVYKAS